jgi:hypothetical protein
MKDRKNKLLGLLSGSSRTCSFQLSDIRAISFLIFEQFVNLEASASARSNLSQNGTSRYSSLDSAARFSQPLQIGNHFFDRQPGSKRKFLFPLTLQACCFLLQKVTTLRIRRSCFRYLQVFSGKVGELPCVSFLHRVVLVVTRLHGHGAVFVRRKSHRPAWEA